MKKHKRNRGFVRRWFERLLLLAGIAGVGLWLWSNALPIASQAWDNWIFESELRHETATVGTYLSGKANQVVQQVEDWCRFLISESPDELAGVKKSPDARPFVPNKEIVGRLTIERLRLSTIVREGSGQDTLGIAVGHIPGTALPGQGGNVGIAGHRDTLFRGLRGIQDGDMIRFEMLDATYNYQVESTQIVAPSEVSVLKAGSHPELTLVTCYPFNYIGSAPDRFIVKARQVSRSPQQNSAAQIADNRSEDKPPAPAARAADQPERGKSTFTVPLHHSRQLAPGISIGIDEADAAGQSVYGWMWLMPDRRTIWLRHRSPGDPLVFYGGPEGTRHELRITKVTRDSVSGYLIERPLVRSSVSDSTRSTEP